MASNCKGPHTVTAKVDAETKESLDSDAERLEDFRADRVRDALSLYLAMRRGEWRCPSCGKPAKYEPEP